MLTKAGLEKAGECHGDGNTGIPLVVVGVGNILLWNVAHTRIKPIFPSLGSHHQLLANLVSSALHLCHRPAPKQKKEKINVKQIPAKYPVLLSVNISVCSSKR